MVRRGPNGARRNLPSLAWGIIAASVFALAGVKAESPGIREDGGASLARLARELGSHAVVLSVAMEPGQEDLATLATLEIGEGARVFSLYVTDGAATLSDFNGDSPMRLAGRRREEAYAASARVGAEAYFLNLPDVGVIDDTAALHRYWIPDSVEAKLTRALLYCRPDVILVNRDFRGAPGTTPRQSVMLAALGKAIRAAGRMRADNKPRAETAWAVGRVFVDRGDSSGTFHVNAGRLDPSLHKSYREIARESATTYETLRGVMGRRAEGDRVYSLVHPAGGRTPRTFLEGLPVLSSKVRDMLKAAQRAVRSAPPGALSSVSGSIDEAQYLLIHEMQSLSPADLRVCTSAKNILEDVRCRLLHVQIRYDSSDSLLTERQVFYLRFSTLTSKNMEIVFPEAMNKVWWINESEDFRFPLNKPQEFTIITPDKLVYNTPASVYGLESELPRVPFPFIVFHKDSVRSKNFAFRGDLQLRTGPRRALEILTPVVRAYPGEKLAFSLLNISRNAFKGSIAVGDSIVSAGPKPLFLPDKDFILEDTLALQWNPGTPDGEYIVNVRINGEKVAWFTARKFPVAADTSAPVGLFSALQSSPVETALRRMHVPYVTLDSSRVSAASLAGIRTVLIDRDALALRSDASLMESVLVPWVREGGHLVVLPQFELDGQAAFGGVGFSAWPALAPESAVRTDSTSRLLRIPNDILADDWKGWVVARALGSVRLPAGQGVSMPVTTKDTGAPLVAEITEGTGRITVVALDLVSQLMNVHPGSFRLLANLVAGK